MSPFVGDVVTASSVTMVEDKVDETQTESSAQPGLPPNGRKGNGQACPIGLWGA